jgi:NADPH:quinone reductase-like Zn-dependent oxidoreductase
MEIEMKAIVHATYGPPDVLQFKDTEKPVPQDDQVLIKVHAASVNALDGHLLGQSFMIRFTGSGLLKPKDPRYGVDLAGRVEAVGRAVTRFRPGDEVFGGGVGAFAEYACAKESELALKPASISFEIAAAVPVAALTALQGLRDQGQIQPGQKVLINGGSGGVGTFAVQLAKAFGAAVTAVCSPRNVDLVRSIGADQVIDYTREDVTRSGQRYDLILAVNGYHSIFAYQRALCPEGVYVMVGGSKDHLLQAVFQAMVLGPLISRTGKQRVRFFVAKLNQKDLALVMALVEAGKVVPVIDRRYSLSETVEAIRYLEKGHASGKIVITV